MPDGLALADPRRPVRGRLHHLAALRRRLPQCPVDARLPGRGRDQHGFARICGAHDPDGHRLRGLGRHRRDRHGPGRDALVRRAGDHAPHALHPRHRRLHRRPEADRMSIDEGLFAWVEEALEPMGRVSMRKMMGAAVLYLDGIVFAVLDDSELWFKADAESAPTWDEAGCQRFSMTMKDGRVETMNYRGAPTDVYD